MYLDNIIEAVKEHCFEGIVIIFLLFFYNPAKYIENYRSWPETNIFIFFFSIFLLFARFFKRPDFKFPRLNKQVKLLLIGGFIISDILNFLGLMNLYNKFILFFARFFKWLDFKFSRSKNHVKSLLTGGFIISGILAFVGVVNLYYKFISMDDPFFWEFIGKYIFYIIAIISLLAFASLAVEYIYRHIE